MLSFYYPLSWLHSTLSGMIDLGTSDFQFDLDFAQLNLNLTLQNSVGVQCCKFQAI